MDPTTTASSTIHLLESRLHRLTYLLTGDANWTGTPSPPSKPSSHEETISRRLLHLETELERLRAKSAVARDILGLYDRFPDLFAYPLKPKNTTPHPPHAPAPARTFTEETDTDLESGSGLPLETQASIILSYASSFPETASRLTSLQDLPIPDAEVSASLIELQPRIERVAGVQEGQAREISELRVRTAKVLQRWYEVSVLGGGEVWGEWEGRIEDVERGVRRGEVGRERGGL
ncbi:putative nuclear distribution protein RO10 [Aspergillus lucknowensis]|uniref:Nuclear distribution protein RO10 n=1 Tax=Aspergillus lucknowensis TaxID=176173 RepID=A0ABR4LXR7_9EURO